MMQQMRKAEIFLQGLRYKITLLLLFPATAHLCSICVTLMFAILCLRISEKDLRTSSSSRCTPHKFAIQLLWSEFFSAVYAATAYFVIFYLAWENITFGLIDKFVSCVLKSVVRALNGCDMASVKNVLIESKTYLTQQTYNKNSKEKREEVDSLVSSTDSKIYSGRRDAEKPTIAKEDTELETNTTKRPICSILVFPCKFANKVCRFLTCKRHKEANESKEVVSNKHISKCIRVCKCTYKIVKYVIIKIFENRVTDIIILFTVLTIVLLAHIIQRKIEMRENDIVEERFRYVVRIAADTFVFTVCLTCLVVTNINKIWKWLSKSPQHKLWRQGFKYTILCIFISIVLYIVHITTPYLQALQTEYELQRSILGELVNPCATEGRVMNSSLRASEVWPALTPKWLVTVRHQNASCYGSNWHTLGFIDDSEMHIDTPLLVIPAMCPDHSTPPRVFVERPSRTAGNWTRSSSQDKDLNTDAYHAELEALFGSEEKAKSKKLIVHRTKKSKLITEVEVDLSQYSAHERKAISQKETQIRRHWPTSVVYEIPLGYSAAYSLSCSQGQHEEVFMFPPILHMAMESSVQSHLHLPSSEDQSVNSVMQTNASHKPAGKVLILLFDALSRQEAFRSLPHFFTWMQKFRARQEKSNDSEGSVKKEGYVVLEALAHSIIGGGTYTNFVPYLTGISINVARKSKSKVFKWEAANRSLFTIAKETHGDVINTAFTSGYCGNFFEQMLGDNSNSSGRGTSTNNVDYHFWEPMCHEEYSSAENSHRDWAASCVRCVANKNVHQHLFDYTTHLLRRQLSNRNRTKQNKSILNDTNFVNHTNTLNENKQGNEEFFFDLSYFLEAHERSFSVIKQVDDDLVAFMEHLDNELHYFDDPLNSFIFLADHGMHYGYYHETHAGKFEHSTPTALYVIHPEVFRRIDANKQQKVGMSETNFRNRLKRIYSPLDVYLTLADELNINATVFERYNSLKQTLNSLLNAHNSFYATQYDDFITKQEKYFCFLDFCS